MPDPLLSVVIPTYNRADRLGRTLAALAAQDGVGAGAEVIVVDDGSTDDTAAVLARHRGVVAIRQANAGPAAARNRGWRAARGVVVAFCDDDTVPDRRWLADLWAALAADPGLGAVGGQVRPLRASFLARFVQAEQHASHGVGRDGAIRYLVTANCAYRRDVLASLGGFDESFPTASGEDADLTLRARAAGHRLALIDGAVVLHEHPDRLGAVLRTYRRHGRSRRAVIERNPAAGWRHSRRDLFTVGHWSHRARAYRRAGLGRAGTVAALVLRLAGLAAYAAGMAGARRAAGCARPGRLTVLVACPGAGRVNRGYERVARQLADLLAGDPRLAVTLATGPGRPRDGATRLLALRRDRALARLASRVLTRPGTAAAGLVPAARRQGAPWSHVALGLARRRLAVTPYEIEAATFGASLLALVAVRRPDVVVVQDVPTARVLALGRCLPGWRSRVLFVNGAPWPAPYRFADVVQHVSPVTWDADPGDGWQRALLPLGTALPAAPSPATATAARQRFGLPEAGPVVVTVGTLLDRHKRHLHVVSELASLPEPRPFLVVAGAPEADQARIEAVARDLLGDRWAVVNAGPDEVAELLCAADAFVLASLEEGFGLAYLEALAAGLPAVVHDGRLQRWLLGELATYVDMGAPGALAGALASVLARGDRWSGCERRRRYVAERFSWPALRASYVALVRQTAGTGR